MDDEEIISSVVLNESNGWNHTFPNLPKCKDGKDISYQFTEENIPEGYSSTVYRQGNNYTIHNGYRYMNVRKVWYDYDNRDNLRPNNITVKLLDGENLIASVVLNESNGWYHEFERLPKYDEEGRTIRYIFAEENVPEEYSSYVTYRGDDYTINNGYVSLSVKKLWIDNNDENHCRPSNVTVILKAGYNNIASVVLNESNGWYHDFGILPKYNQYGTIVYSITEDDVPQEYQSSVSSVDGKYTLRNSYVTQAKVNITWDDDDNQDSTRPKNIFVHLNADGKLYRTYYLSSVNNWSYTFDRLPMYDDDGTKIVYTIEQSNLPDYYLQKLDTSDNSFN